MLRNQGQNFAASMLEEDRRRHQSVSVAGGLFSTKNPKQDCSLDTVLEKEVFHRVLNWCESP